MKIELVLAAIIVFMVMFIAILLIQNTLELYLAAAVLYVSIILASWEIWKNAKTKSENEPVLSIEYNEKGMPDTFARVLRIMGKDGKFTGVTKKYLMVNVNNMGGVARNCKAEFQLTDRGRSAKAPSENPKPLPWADESLPLKKDIGARKGSELLEVIFSSSEFADFPDDGVHALVSTKDSLQPEAPFIRPQDGFGVGDFKIKITVTSEDGSSVSSTFGVHVEREFKKLSMKKL